MDNFPLLSVITYLPLVGMLALFILPKVSNDAARWIALGTSIVTFVVSLLLLSKGLPEVGGEAGKFAPMIFSEQYEWLPGIGISYHFGADGLSILFVLLTTLLTPLSIIISWSSVSTRVREFHISMLLLETGLIGAFLSLDLFLFYVFFELSLIPMALIIGIWGSSNRVYSAIKFFLYTLAGSLLMLVAIVATYQSYFNQTGKHTLDVLELATQTYGVPFQYWVFAAFFIAFAIKVPMWPVHTWLPDAHTEAPTAGSVMLAAVMLKLGGYGMLRFCLPLYPEAARYFAPAIMILSTIAIIYGALVALPQPDWKRLVAYSSVSHMGFVTLGIFAFNQQALQGAVFVMFAHGLNTAALFLLVGIVYERAHTRTIKLFRGLSSTMPIYAAFFCAFTFASIGLPGMTGFVGEFHALMGAFRGPVSASIGNLDLYRTTAIISTAVVILSAWYMLWLFQRVAQGTAPGLQLAHAHAGGHGGHDAHGHEADHGGDQIDQDHRAAPDAHGVETGHDPHDPAEAASHDMHLTDVKPREILTLAPLLVLTILFGVFPGPIFQLVSPTLESLLTAFK
ncbi:MAG: NADH-quinone oxidoreductase subunit M [Thermomicrobiales bacterium]